MGLTDIFLVALTVQGTSITIPSGSDSYSAIDTGTTLVGGPSTYISSLYSQIPGATLGTGNFDGYYIYRAFFPFFQKLDPV